MNEIVRIVRGVVGEIRKRRRRLVARGGAAGSHGVTLLRLLLHPWWHDQNISRDAVDLGLSILIRSGVWRRLRVRVLTKKDFLEVTRIIVLIDAVHFVIVVVGGSCIQHLDASDSLDNLPERARSGRHRLRPGCHR